MSLITCLLFDCCLISLCCLNFLISSASRSSEEDEQIKIKDKNEKSKTPIISRERSFSFFARKGGRLTDVNFGITDINDLHGFLSDTFHSLLCLKEGLKLMKSCVKGDLVPLVKKYAPFTQDFMAGSPKRSVSSSQT